MSDGEHLTRAARDLARVHTRIASRAAQALDERDAAIRDAVTAGARQADVARATGLTRARVAQIVTSEAPVDPA